MGGGSRTRALATVVGVLLLMLLTTFAEEGEAQKVSPTETSAPIPTMSLPLTPSPTPFIRQNHPANRGCLPASMGTPPSGAIEALVYLLNDDPLLDFFNQGGTIETLRATLDTAGNQIGPYLSQVIAQDVTGDAIPEIFVAITDAIVSVNYGESHLIMFQCVDNTYQETILFRRAGAGSRAEGLYTGGGVHILSIADLNSDDTMDLVFEVDCWMPTVNTPSTTCMNGKAMTSTPLWSIRMT